MRRNKWVALTVALATAAVAMVCVIPLTAAGNGSVVEAQAQTGDHGEGLIVSHPQSEEMAGAVDSQAQEQSGDAEAGKTVADNAEDGEAQPQEPDVEANQPVVQEPEGPVIAAPPQAPANLTLDYEIRSHTVKLAWDAVSDPFLDRYLVKRWDQGDVGVLGWIFSWLADMNPEAGPFVDGFNAQVELLGQEGWTYTEQMSIMEALAEDMDALLGIMISTPSAGWLLNFALNQATEYSTRETSYDNRIYSANTYYIYTVLVRNRWGEIGDPSNCEGVYAVFADHRNPSRPSGVAATAYDPGVGLQWSRNSEDDLAGYNVYLVEGQSRTKLNQNLVTTGTAFFYDVGVAGAEFGVTAVDMTGRESQIATATAVLAPATVYYQDDPAWQFTGQWVQEHYEYSGGSALRVAQDPGVTASIAFTGRMVKVYSAYYWSCGSARFYVDGVDYGTRNLYNPSTHYHMQPLVITGLAPGPHTLTIEVVGSGGAEGFNFVNFDSIEVR